MLEMAKMTYTLSQQYEEKIRPFIDIIDNLRSLGVEKDLALPAIAVIGDQSSGKSSILEALSGVPLPRGSGIVTRCPLELKMIRSTDEDEWHGRISYQDHEEDFDDPAEVEKKIIEAQDMMAGGGVGISEELISLQITSANVPDLTLIDLPGIARVAVNGQPEDIGDQIKKLIKKFVTKQETINLVVVPSNVDIATTEALRIAQKYDPEGERTLGILTKPDLVDKGTEETVVDIVHNKVFPLKKGYMIVKCRGQIEIVDRVSLKQATEAEDKFFKDHPDFSNLYDDGFATIPKLAEKLTSELVYHIEKSLPRLKEQTEKKLAETEKELVPYSNGPPSDSKERDQFLIEKITDFTDNVLNLIRGNVDACDSGQLIFPELRKVFAEWDGTLDRADSMNDMKKEVENYEEKYRGKELPGFINYRTFESLICRKIMELEEPALGMLKTVSDMIRKRFINLARRSFNGFPNLLKTTRSKIEDIKLSKESLAENQVKAQFKMECVVYSQDGGYSQALKQSKEKSKENGQTKESEDNHASLDEMKFHLITYYTIVRKRLADQIPMVILYLLLQEAGKELRKNMSLNENDGVDHLLKEDYDIVQKRERLLNRKQRLTTARDLLAEWETNI